MYINVQISYDTHINVGTLVIKSSLSNQTLSKIKCIIHVDCGLLGCVSMKSCWGGYKHFGETYRLLHQGKEAMYSRRDLKLGWKEG
jgi:hypothetical protein